MSRAKELGLELPKAEHFQAFAGKGIQARVDGREILLGTRALLEGFSRSIVLNGLADTSEAPAHAGATPLYVAVGDQPAGLISGCRHDPAGVARGGRAARGHRPGRVDADR